MKNKLLYKYNENDAGVFDISVYAEDKKVAFITFKLKSNTAWLYKVFVNDEYRNMKIGSTLLKLFENFCVQHFVKAVEGKYYPETEDKIVRQFYENNGYSIDKEYYETFILKYNLKKSDVDVEVENIDEDNIRENV